MRSIWGLVPEWKVLISYQIQDSRGAKNLLYNSGILDILFLGWGEMKGKRRGGELDGDFFMLGQTYLQSQAGAN